MSLADKRSTPIDGALRGRANPTMDELDKLRFACRDHGVSEKTKLVLARLASYPPTVRLVVNLKTIAGLMVDGPIHNILSEGLLPEERAALVELDMCGLSTHAREIAHGLLNVHERWYVMKSVGRMFKAAEKAKNAYLTPGETDKGPGNGGANTGAADSND